MVGGFTSQNNGFGSSTFGATNNTAGGLFGATQSQPAGLFGTGTLNQPMTSSTSTGFGGGGGNTGVFGSTNTASTGGLFSQQNNAFALNTSNTSGGTTVKFNPVIGSEMMTRHGMSTSIKTEHQCITAMKDYKHKSLEELRQEDYQAGRKGPSNTRGGGVAAVGGLFPPSTASTGFGGGTSGSTLFGSTNTGSTPMFGSPSPNTGLSSGQPTATFGANAPGGNLFGSQTQGNQTASLFNPPSASGGQFGVKTQNSTAPGMGFGSVTFGQTNAGIGTGNTQQPSTAPQGFGTGSGLFGQTNTGIGTGNTQQPSMAQGFGTGSGLFGKTKGSSGTGAGPFGQTSTGFGTGGPQTSPAPGMGFGSAPFGQTNTGIGTGNTQQPSMAQGFGPGSGLFGQTNTTIGTGNTQQPGTAPGFGSGSGLFGQTNTATGTGNTQQPGTTPGFGSGSSGLFGHTNTAIGTGNTQQPGTAPGLGTGSGLFGQANTGIGTGNRQQPPSTAPGFGTGPGIFGQTNTGIGTGNTQLPSMTPGLGTGPFGQSNTSFGTGNMQQPGTAPGLGTGSGLFGQTNTGIGTGTTQLPGTNLFGKTTGFGPQSNVFDNKTGAFGTTTLNPSAPGTGIFGSSNLGYGAPQQPCRSTVLDRLTVQEALYCQRFMNSLMISPYGDSPLFRNPLTDRKEEPLKTANLPRRTTPTHLIRTPRRATTYLPRTLTPQGSASKLRLFAGLDEESAAMTKGTFVPRKSIKRLVLKDVSSRVVEDTATDFDPQRRARDHGSSEQVTEGASSEQAIRVQWPERREEQPEIKEEQPEIKEEQPERRYEQQERKEESEQENQAPPHPAGVVLSRFGYYTIPPVEELADFVDENGRCLVENFTVGRKDYGSVHFPGPVDVSGLNLDDIVHFRRKEVIIYPDDSRKPPQGQGLNMPAQVTLDGVWPVDKTSGGEIRSPERLAQVHYPSRLESACVKLGSKFLDYRYETGSWVFEVSHF